MAASSLSAGWVSGLWLASNDTAPKTECKQLALGPFLVVPGVRSHCRTASLLTGSDGRLHDVPA